MLTTDKQSKVAYFVVLCICKGSSETRYKQCMTPVKLAEYIALELVLDFIKAVVHFPPFCQQKCTISPTQNYKSEADVSGFSTPV